VTGAPYDVFLSYHHGDHAAVERLARRLVDHGLRVFLDRWYLAAGQPWPQALEAVLAQCRAVVVFLGAQGMGPWQQREQYLALDRQTRSAGFPVIPVVLPGADPPLGFLRLGTWVDLRGGIEDASALAILEAGIRGQPPGPDARDHNARALASVRPYRGLEPFREEDASLFFGREEFTDRLTGAVEQASLVAVVGASGSGKSSVVRAGLIPRLRAGQGSGAVWEVVTMVPTDRPLESLAAALVPLLEPDLSEVKRLGELTELAGGFLTGKISLRQTAARCLTRQPGTNRLLLFVDQWEELYTLCRDQAAAARFLEQVLDATAAGTLAVVLTMRGDFFGQALSHRGLADRLQGAQVNLGPMTRDELQRSITAPLDTLDLHLEPGLVERILGEVGGEPGNLPLLEFVMAELWEKRQGRTLHHAAYEAMGCLHGAIAARADQEFSRLDGLEQVAARRALVGMVRPGEGTEDTRQRAPLPVNDPVALSALRRLADARLLVTGRDAAAGETVEVAHEALIRKWTLLRGWVNEDRDFLRARARVEGAAALWEKERDPTRLLSPGRPLAEGEELLQKRRAELAASSIDFIERSKGRARRSRRIARTIGGAGVLALALLAAVSVLSGRRATLGQEEARRQAEAARQISAAADFDVAALYLEQGDKEAPRALAHLARALATWPKEWRAEYRLKSLLSETHWAVPLGSPLHHESGLLAASFSPDGKRVVTASYDNTARLWDALTGQPLGSPMRHEDSVVAASFGPDGTRVVTASDDKTARLWNGFTGQPLGSPMRHESDVFGVSFSPDGKRVVTASDDKTARLWDAITGQPLGSPMRHKDSVAAASFSPDGRRVVTASDDRTARVWDGLTGQPVGSPLPHEGLVLAASFSPDNERVVTASDDKTARLWNAITGQPLGSPMRHEGWVLVATFSPDNKRLVTASDDNTARLWDAITGQPLGSPLRHEGPVRAATFSPDGRRVVTASDDNTARLWDALVGQPLGSSLRHERPVPSASFSPDGMRVVTASYDKTARLWDAPTGQPLGSPLRHQGSVATASFSPDGMRVVTASYDKTARLWDALTEQPLGSPMRHDSPVRAASFSPDGERVATASYDKTARLWDALTGQPIGSPLRHEGPVRAVAFSPDSKRVATASDDNTARLWDALTGQPLGSPMRHDSPVRAASFSKDGMRVVTASYDKTARLWDALTGQPLGSPMRHERPVLAASFSADGNRVVTASEDKTARVWDGLSGEPLGSPLSHENLVHAASFSPDGKRVVTASDDKTARLWDALTGQPLGSPLRHEGLVRAASFSPDGKRVVTASFDKTARLWDALTGQPLDSPLKHVGDVRSASFSPDGGRIIAVSGHEVRIWNQPDCEGIFPEWARRWVEAVGTRRFDQAGALLPASALEIPPGLTPDAPFVRFAGWFMSKGEARTIAPGSTRTLREWVDDRLREDTPESLKEAYGALPGDKRVLAAMARHAAGP
jgi:WD40 repeat protein